MLKSMIIPANTKLIRLGILVKACVSLKKWILLCHEVLVGETSRVLYENERLNFHLYENLQQCN